MRVLILGAGAAGLAAAGAALKAGHRVTVLERNPRPARKVMITGKGRCNLTNDSSVEECVACTPRNGRFLYSALSAFTPRDTMAWMESLGVPLKVERGKRVFPVSDKAADVADALVRWAKGARFVTGRAAELILENGLCKGAVTETGERLEAEATVIATGGLSYPGTGSTGDGYILARQAGHTVTPTRPSLVPLICREPDCAAMQGVSLKNTGMRVEDTLRRKTVYEDFGELLFTHFGVSGPTVLSASAHMDGMAPDRYRIRLDLKPALTPEQLDARLQRELTAEQNRAVGNMLPNLLPRSMVAPAADRAGIPPEKKCREVTREERRALGAVLKDWTLTVTGFRPVAEAVITCGGVSVKEVDARTMASKLVKGLYFAGEVLDLDAYTGGFNLQIAFATGMAAGRGLKEGESV